MASGSWLGVHRCKDSNRPPGVTESRFCCKVPGLAESQMQMLIHTVPSWADKELSQESPAHMHATCKIQIFRPLHSESSKCLRFAHTVPSEQHFFWIHFHLQCIVPKKTRFVPVWQAHHTVEKRIDILTGHCVLPWWNDSDSSRLIRKQQSSPAANIHENRSWFGKSTALVAKCSRANGGFWKNPHSIFAAAFSKPKMNQAKR